MSEPVFVSLLFADRVITENTNKKGIIGTFNRFMAPQFPISFPPWAIYAAVTNAAGQYDFALTLANTENNQVILPINGEFECGSDNDVVELIFNVAGAVFPKAGTYSLAFHVAGELLASRILFVDQVEVSPA